MKKSLLEIVKDILNDLDGDEVNSINDTIESQQVAQIVRSSYEEMIGNRNWPHLRKLMQLDSLSDSSKPNYLQMPEGLKELVTFRYDRFTLTNTKSQIQDIKYLDPDAFLRMISLRDSTSTSVTQVTDFSGVKLLIVNDQPPTYWTSFDDVYIVTDSYDSGVDTTLQSSKTQCVAYVEPTWTHADDAIPDLPSEAFPALVEEAKSTAFFVLKQMANQKAEQKATRQQRWLSRKAFRAKGGVKYPNYGRTANK